MTWSPGLARGVKQERILKKKCKNKQQILTSKGGIIITNFRITLDS